MNQYSLYPHHNYQKVADLKNKIIGDTDKQDREDTNNQLAILSQLKEYKRYVEGTYMDKQIRESALRRDIRLNIINIVFKRINEHYFKYQVKEEADNDKKEIPLNTSTQSGYPTYHTVIVDLIPKILTNLSPSGRRLNILTPDMCGRRTGYMKHRLLSTRDLLQNNFKTST
uniref:Uncharacterized protein n=1 Tax=Meloidogyne enterolobii TaxID=390850 RepID=A0A6V7UHQ8_MELEN|nr:unnamed protein product [Meloidogyne enterolobii]